MASEAVARTIRERIKEIDDALGQYRDLTREREALQGALDFYEGHRSTVSLFRDQPPATPIPSLTRFVLRKESKTNRIVNAVADILEGTPGNAAPFPSLLAMLPRDVFGTGEYANEGVRTAIKRAGHRRGIRYENGGTVRLIKSPQAETA
jgi:hypothetical protein